MSGSGKIKQRNYFGGRENKNLGKEGIDIMFSFMELPESHETAESNTVTVSKFYLAGFWRRLVAMLIDGVILGSIGFLLSVFFEHQFARMGQYGKAIGFVIAAFYFSICNSKIGNGQTVGKRTMNLRVVCKDGSLLSPLRSFMRFIVLALPYFLNGVFFESGSAAFSFLLTFIVFGMGFSILYLFLFNRTTRQSLHDILTGTFVVNNYSERVNPLKIPGLHYAIVGLLLAAPLIVTGFIPTMLESDSMSELAKTRLKIMELPFINSASINDLTSKVNGVSTTNLIVKAFLKSNDVKNEALALQVAEIVLANDLSSHGRDKITIVLGYGYDIGIASMWNTLGHVESPYKWTEMSKH